MKIAIRANGGIEIGMGHIMRTLSLSKELVKFHEVIYICEDDYKFKNGVEKIQSEGFEATYDRIEYADLLLVDSYDVSERYFNELKNNYKYVVYIDDLNLFYHSVDLVINQNINAEELGYTEPNTLLGTKYVLLREEFKNIPPKEIKEQISDILITMGGADPHETTYNIIEQLKGMSWKLHVVVGPAFVNKEKLFKLKSDNVIFYEYANMKQLMEVCDLAISSCGSTLYELCSCGTPTLSIVVADNQIGTAKKFHREDLIHNLGFYNEINYESLKNSILNLSNKPEVRKEISQRMRNIVDGHGAERITKYINKSYT